jgi:hypothetical protein
LTSAASWRRPGLNVDDSVLVADDA